ncbi:MAG: hypothetical protein KAF27_11880 [Porphyrobacter sp.]|nr:hypothetical protein [Porphyrobacter sp.]
MPSDNFYATLDSLIAPARNCFPITPDNTAELAILPKAIYVGGGGNLVVRAVDSAQDVTFVNVAAGSLLDVRVVAVRQAGTTATNIVGLAR